MASIKPSIVVVGSLNIDYVTTTPRCPAAGETLTATSLTISAGGKGANQAAACGRASIYRVSEDDIKTVMVSDVHVAMVGSVGKDDIHVERLLLPALEYSSVDVDGISRHPTAQTGTASIVLESNTGENRIMIVPGANQEGMSDVLEVLGRIRRNGRHPDVVVMQGEIPRITVLDLVREFNQPSQKTKVVFNPAPVFPDGIPIDALQGLHTLVVNEGEAIMLANSSKKAGFDTSNLATEEDLEDEKSLSSLTEQFHRLMGIEIVIITLGARGTYIFDSNNGQSSLIPAVKVNNVVDTTAAGDTFIGYYAVALARHNKKSAAEKFDVQAAVTGANAAAAKCVQKAGAIDSIPFGYEV